SAAKAPGTGRLIPKKRLYPHRPLNVGETRLFEKPGFFPGAIAGSSAYIIHRMPLGPSRGSVNNYHTL
ncbi:MAG: hypothetical protein J7M34_13730, partial [Anaerolineae bacterium]|nr:hypothetical protein [Anaerolineae bacterium]